MYRKYTENTANIQQYRGSNLTVILSAVSGFLGRSQPSVSCFCGRLLRLETVSFASDLCIRKRFTGLGYTAIGSEANNTYKYRGAHVNLYSVRSVSLVEKFLLTLNRDLPGAVEAQALLSDTSD